MVKINYDSIKWARKLVKESEREQNYLGIEMVQKYYQQNKEIFKQAIQNG